MDTVFTRRHSGGPRGYKAALSQLCVMYSRMNRGAALTASDQDQLLTQCLYVVDAGVNSKLRRRPANLLRPLTPAVEPQTLSVPR